MRRTSTCQPCPQRRGPERGRGGALIGGDGAQHRQQRSHDERRGHQRVAERDQPPARRASRTGAVSNVISMPRPMVTAEVPSGSIMPTSSSRPWRRAAAIASAASPPTTTLIAVATTAYRSDTSERGERVDAEADAGPHLASRRACARRVSDQRPPRRNERGHQHHQRQRHHDDGARATGDADHAPLVPSASVPLAASAAAERAAAARRCHRADHHTTTAEHQQLQHRQHRRAVDVAQLRGPAGDLHLQRRVRRAAQQLHHAERGEREQEHHRRRRPQRRPQQRQHDVAQHAAHGDAPSVRAAAVRSGGSTAHIAPDQPHDHRDVEEHVRDDHRPRVPCHASGSSARNAAPTTTVGSMNGTVTSASSARRPGNR